MIRLLCVPQAPQYFQCMQERRESLVSKVIGVKNTGPDHENGYVVNDRWFETRWQVLLVIPQELKVSYLTTLTESNGIISFIQVLVNTECLIIWLGHT